MRRETAFTTELLTIGMMAKYWEIGKVKTRLGKTIGMSRAARIHQIFVQHLCTVLGNVGDVRSLCLAPIQRREDVAKMLDSHPDQPQWTINDQGDGDLGERMQRWFPAQLAKQGSCAILIGADCPTIDRELIQRAQQRLQDHDVVIGPAADGGYYLIGFGGVWSEIGSKVESLFHDVPWSTPDVLAVTMTRVVDAGLSVAQLETQEDVDTIAELNHLLDRLGMRGAASQDSGLKTAIEQTLNDPSLADSA